MAGALGFEPRMVVPKTTALPLGYAPKYISYNTIINHYIVFDKTDQYFGCFFLMFISAFCAALNPLKYPTQTDPDPVILEKTQCFCFPKKLFNLLIFG